MHAPPFSLKGCALLFAKVALLEAVESAVHCRTDVSPFSPGRFEREIEGKHAVANSPKAREPA
ncbi:MAG: hypothetical protein IIC90_11000 [Chloroflexi bacterium]|nr:hypothetical protein [Chloroflexota bacterium]